MRRGRHILFLLMAIMLVVSPTVGAEATPEAAPDEGAAPAVVETPGDVEGETGEDPAAGDASEEAGEPVTGDESGEGDASTPEGEAPATVGTSRQASTDVAPMAVGDGTIVVNVVGSDPAQPVPTGALVCVSVIWNCVPWTGTPLTFTVPAGEYTVSFDMFDESYYTDTNTTVTVAEGETLDVTLTLEPRQPSTLRLYVSTDTGAPVPAGTEACVQQDATAYTDAVDECQPVTGMFLDFAVNEGWVDVTVTAPLGSGFGGKSEQVWVPGGTVYRDYFVLEDDADGFVTIDVSTEDGMLLTGIPALCFQHATEDLERCSWVGVPVQDGDGAANYTFHVPAGEWTWIVEPAFSDSRYLPVSGTVTVAEGDELVIEAMLPLRTEADVASVTVNVTTFDGNPVPAGTQVCAEDLLSDTCVDWAGEPVVLEVAAGPVMVAVNTPDDSGYLRFSLFLPFVETGDTRVVDAVLYPLDTELTIVKTVSDEAPEVGDTVSYTIHAFGPALEFLIEDVLPVELTDISVTCVGAFISELPGRCYEIHDGIVVVPGIAQNEAFLDVTLIITGTVTGTPGTTVTNIACVTSFVWTGDEVDCDSADFVIAETVVPTPDPVDPKPQPTPDKPHKPEPAKPGEKDAGTVTKLPSTGVNEASSGTAVGPVVGLYAALVAGVLLMAAGALRIGSRR